MEGTDRSAQNNSYDDGSDNFRLYGDRGLGTTTFNDQLNGFEGLLDDGIAAFDNLPGLAGGMEPPDVSFADLAASAAQPKKRASVKKQYGALLHPFHSTAVQAKTTRGENTTLEAIEANSYCIGLCEAASSRGATRKSDLGSKKSTTVGYIMACKLGGSGPRCTNCPVTFKVVISDVDVGALAALPCNGKTEVFGQTDAAGVLIPHDHANYGASKTSKKMANDTSLEHHHKIWLQQNILNNATAFHLTGVPAVQMMRQAGISGSIDISPDKVTRFLARERKKLNKEQDLCTFGGLHEYVHSLLMFSADNSDSFHSSFDTKAADAIHEMRFIHMDVEVEKQRFVLVWSSVHLLLNLYRSQSRHLPHGGWLGCDTTHGLVYKFGTKEFLLSSFNTMDLERRSHRVADMLSSATCSEVYKFGLKAVTDATRKVLRIHCRCATSQVPAPLDGGVEVVSAAGEEHSIHSASTASQGTETADASSKPISAAGLLYQIAAGRNVDIGASPDEASFGMSIIMSDNDKAIQ